MLPHEFVEARNNYPVCWMAYGLAEPHGAFNALGLDWLKADGITKLAAQKHGGIVAPPFAWHVHEVPEFHGDGKTPGWLRNVGVYEPFCNSIPPRLFAQIAFFNIRTFDARNFRAAILITGHCGGPEHILKKACQFYTERTGSPIRLYALCDAECIDRSLPFRGDHAGMTETSQLMALHPDLVDLNNKTCSPDLGERYAGNINFDKQPLPSIKIGEEIIESQIKNLGIIAQDLLNGYVPVENWTAPDLNEAQILADEFVATELDK